jgi:tRNA-specific 2-thiouridylase
MDARRAADRLGIPFYVWDFSERFRDDVIDDFVAEYRAGRTPNPCMRCNEKIKFAALLERALELGFDAVCTGHYAIARRRAGRARAAPASDEAKDQSYVLGVLTAPSSRTPTSRSDRRRPRPSCAPKRPSAG